MPGTHDKVTSAQFDARPSERSGIGFQQILELGKRTVRGSRVGFTAKCPAGYWFIQVASVFVIVAVEAQQLPVAAVGGGLLSWL
jgi:hypothetical protein